MSEEKKVEEKVTEKKADEIILDKNTVNMLKSLDLEARSCAEKMRLIMSTYLQATGKGNKISYKLSQDYKKLIEVKEEVRK